VAIQYSRASITRFCRDVATVDKWSSKTTQIRNLEKELGGVLRNLSNVTLNNVDRRVMELQKEVLERLSDIQRGLEVLTFVLRASIFAYCSFIEYQPEPTSGKACLCQVRHI
jgi:hypothetical protein